MKTILEIVRRFGADQDGAALIEYTVLLGVMLVATAVTIIKVGNWVNERWSGLSAGLNP